jgi:hypothetical protein
MDNAGVILETFGQKTRILLSTKKKSKNEEAEKLQHQNTYRDAA